MSLKQHSSTDLDYLSGYSSHIICKKSIKALFIFYCGLNICVLSQFDTDFFGMYILHQPNLVLRSPELIKQVLVKDFSYFADRNILINERDDPYASKMLFFMKNPEWKQTRNGLSPVFTSGKVG